MADGRPANLRDADAADADRRWRRAAWCCWILPLPGAVACRHPALTVLKMDVERDVELADRYDIRSVPAFLLFKDGVCVERASGKMPFVMLDRMVRRHL